MKAFFQRKFQHLTKKQIKGLLLLFVLLFGLRVAIVFTRSNSNQLFYNQEKTSYYQAIIDSLKNEKEVKLNEIKLFNPNYISSEKSSKLNLSKEEYQRLIDFRATGKFVNSVQEFQQVTKVSNSWIDEYGKFFKFPEWVTNKQNKEKTHFANQYPETKKINVSTTDLNKATFSDLKEVKGIGDVLAQRIIDERNKLGSFVSIKQIDFIKNISPEAAREVKKIFKVSAKNIIKVNTNKASVDELAKIPYLNNYFAKQIVILRSKQSEPIQIEDLEKINGFPIEKLEIITLYLDF